ncbi:beta strand repeat-containing protein [Aliikangiella coralliicola]|uniref:Filamentous haemagglutinin FhaB/tRNA nuclease CdiA-like TPS domain-containing protein n=1 Tax=Aliikangiella coralliicola TaxID=2592383 RepID=A0A545U8U5_9GAMM|nr:hypothetical protein [Aliikangiella coralliicola]TQV85889.1 hypothetical protein FLL46_18370 [Aliikangiella coralliicola]
MKKQQLKTLKKNGFRGHLLVCALTVSPLLIVPGVYAGGPTGGEVVGGTGTINQSGNTTTINQTTQNMAIDWQTFNVASDELVQYIQPNSSSISLNRILSNNGSVIAGRIDANGQVILANPNGVFFTSTSVVNVGGIIASGLDIKPEDFMNGNYIFSEVLGTEGAVINSGMINAAVGGNVALIGRQVENNGMIVANLGSVSLAAGKEAVLTFDQAGLLGVRVSKEILQDELGVDHAVINSGDIRAESGRVLLTASASQNVFSQAVNSGIEHATNVVLHEDGSFTLGGEELYAEIRSDRQLRVNQVVGAADVLNSGSIDTSTSVNGQSAGSIVLEGDNVTSSGELLANAANGNGGHIELNAQDTALLVGDSLTSARSESQGLGGSVEVLGDNVGLFDNSVIDVSGSNGGGEVLIGGDYQGENPYIPNANRTYVSDNSFIYADAINNGDGGKVIVWADESTQFYGNIFARGGSETGDGGLVEVSGKEGMIFDGFVDTTAANGENGLLLLDPKNIIISTDSSSHGTNDYNQFADISGIDTTLNNGDLASWLTTSDVRLRANTDITFAADVTAFYTPAGVATLTLDAGRSIIINDNVTIDLGYIDFVATINHELATSIYRDAGDAQFTMGTGSSIRSNSGDIIIQTGSFSGGSSVGDISLQILNTSGDNVRDAGSISVTNDYGNIVVNDQLLAVGRSGSGDGGDGGNITLTATNGDVTVNTHATLDVLISANGGDREGDNDDGGDAGTISITAGNDILINEGLTANGGIANGGTTGGDENAGDGGTINLNAGNDINLNASIESNGGAAEDNNANSGSGGDITLTVANNLTVGANITTQAGVVGGNGNSGSDGAIVFNGDNSDNTFNINNGASFLAASATLNGLGGNDTLVTGGVLNNTWIVDGTNTGTLDSNNIADELIRFNQIENLTGNSGNDGYTVTGSIVSIDAGDGTNNITVNNGGSVSGAITTGTGNDTVILADVGTGSVGSISAGDGTNIITINTGGTVTNAITSGDGTLDTITVAGSVGSINAGNGTNSITVNNGGSVSGAITTGTGDDTIILADVGTGIVDSISAGDGTNIITVNTGGTVTNAITAGDGTLDTITVAGSVGSINAGNGTNSVTVNNGGIVTGAITTGTGDDTIVLADSGSGSAGSIDVGNGTNSVTVNSGGSVSGAITGGTDVDTINISGTAGSLDTGANNDLITIVDNSSVTGLIDGGAGSDTVTVTTNSGFTITLGTDVDRVETLTAQGSGTNVLVGANVVGGNTWNIAGAGNTVDDSTTQTTFSNFSVITAGTGGDDFFVSTSGVSTINGNSGDDNITLDTVGLVDNVNGNQGTDSLSITNGNSTWVMTTTIDGNVTDTDTPANDTDFTSIETRTGSLVGIDSIDLSGLGAAIIMLADYQNFDQIIGSITGTLQGIDGLQNDWSIQSISGSDGINDGSVTVGGVTTNFLNFLNLIGGNSTDNFTITSSGHWAGDINGGGGVNTLIGANVANTWNVSGAGAGSLLYTTTPGAATTTFSNINTLMGGSNTDDFNLSGIFAGLMDGGAGTDTLTITAAGDQIIQLGNQSNANINIYQVETVTANAATTNELISDGNAATNTWNLNGVRAGDVNDGTTTTTFSNIDNVTGGASVDNFTMAAAFAGLIDGGAGTDSLTITAAGDRIIELGDQVTGNTNVYQIETVAANAATTNELVGDGNAATNTWNLNGVRNGDVNDGSTTTTFTNIDNVTGGATIDNFTMAAAFAGLIDGGAGTDSLTITAAGDRIIELGDQVTTNTNVYQMETVNANAAVNNELVADSTAATNTWTLSGARNGNVDDGSTTTTFTNIDNATGGSTVDNFTLSGNFAGLIDGSAGADSLTITAAGNRIIELGDQVTTNTNVYQIETVNANAAVINELIGDGIAAINTWLLSAARAGSVNDGTTTTAFTNIDNVTGNLNTDNFTLAGDFDGLIDGGAGSDSLTVTAAGDRIIELGDQVTGNTNVYQIETVAANAATTNELVGDGNAATNTWNLSGVRAGDVNDGTTTTTFSNIDNVTGGASIDNFTMAAAFAGLIDGGAGIDSLTVTAAGDRIFELGDQVTANTNVYQIETVAANAATTNELVGDGNAVTNTWNLNGVRNGDVNDGATTTTFTNIDNVTGGATIDNFTMAAAFAGLIDGGAGTDSLTITAAGDRIIELGDQVTANTNVYQMETVNGNAAVSNELVADSTAATNTWTLSGARNGNVDDGSTTTTFTNIDNATGGSTVDNFTLSGNFAGLIDGSAGADSLTITAAGDRIIELGDQVTTNTNVYQIETVNANAAVINELIGDGIAAINTWLLSAARAGSVNDGTTTTAFTNIDNVTGNLNTDNFTLAGDFAGLIDGGAGSDSLTITAAGDRIIELGDQVTANTNVYQIETVAANAATTNELVGDGNAATNTWNLSGVRNGNVNDGTTTTVFTNIDNVTGGVSVDNFTMTANFAGLIDGGAGTDSLTITAAGDRVIELGDQVTANTNVYQIETLDANAAVTNELVSDGNAATNTWNLNGVRNGDVNDGSTTTTFTSIDNVTGGASVDNFTMAANFAGLIDGGAGTDSLTITAAGDRIIELGDQVTANTNVYQMETVNANAAVINELIGDSIAAINTWLLSGARAGNVNDGTTTTAFTNIDNVTGGSTVDNFTLSGNFAGLIDGGSGTDSLTITAAGDRIIELGDQVTTNTNVYQIESIAANAAVTNELVADSTAATNTWTLSGVRDGSVNDGTTATTFTDIDNVTGGLNVDNFTMSAAFAGLIDGGAGTDSLTITAAGDRIIELGDQVTANTNVYQIETVAANAATTNELVGDGNAATNTWNLSGVRAGDVNDGSTTTAFTNIDNVTGGVSVDNFTMAAAFAGLIDGGAGADSLTVTAAGDRIFELGDQVTANTNVYQIETLDANAAVTNELVSDGNAATNTWNLNGVRNGDVNDGSTTTTFTSIDNVTGGASVDNFTMSANFAGLIDGGAGTDSLTITAAGDRIIELGDQVTANTNVYQMETVNANAAVINELIGDSIAAINTWLLSGARAGNVNDGTTTTAFTNIDNATGGSSTDNFTLAADFAGVINGGVGNDTLTITAAGDRVVELGNRRNGNTNVYQIETITANVSATRNELIGDLDQATATHNWTIDGSDTGTLIDGVNNVRFINFTDLTGTDAADVFTFTAVTSAISSLINGMGGIDSLVFALNSGDRTVELGNTRNANLNVYQVENITGDSNANNELIGDSASAENTWTVTSVNGGNVTDGATTTNFTSFATLTGGNSIDRFTVNSGASVTTLNGGDGNDNFTLLGTVDDLNAGDGNDIVTLTGNAVITTIDGGDGNDTFNLQNDLVGGVIGGGDGDDSFNVTGNVTNVTLNGEAGSDNFVVGVVTSLNVNGGEDPDNSDVDSLGSTIDGFTLTLGDAISISGVTATGIEAVSAVNGVLNARDGTTTTWDITGQNSGTVSDFGDSLIFTGFVTLNGGSGVDIFNLSGNGSVSGIVTGGGGNDRLTVDLSGRTQSGLINFEGGSGTDEITVIGTANAYDETYNPNTGGYDQLSYASNSNAASFDLNFNQVATVNDNIQTTSLTINNSGASDNIHIGGTVFGADSGSVDINYDSGIKGNINIVAQNGGDVQILDNINVNGVLSITADQLTQASGVVTANGLTLDAVSQAGSATNTLATNINELRVLNHTGAIFLTEQDGLTIAEITNTSGNIDITTSAGSINSNANLISSGELNLTSAGDIDLSAQNELSGLLSLVAANDINLTNQVTTNLANVSAQNLTLSSQGDINSTGPITVQNAGAGIATLTSTNGSILLNGATNSFDSLTLNAANNISLADLSALNLNATAAADISGNGVIDVRNGGAGVTTLTSTSGNILLSGPTSLFDTVNLSAANEVSLAGLTAQNLDIDSAGDVTVSGELNVQNSGAGIASIDSANGSVLLNGAANNFDSLTLTASNGVSVASLSAQDLTLTAGGDVTSSGNLVVQNSGGAMASITSNNGSISLNGATNSFDTVALNAATDVNLAGLSALNLDIDAGGDINGNGVLSVQNGGNGVATLTSSGGSILLSGGTSLFDTVSFDAANEVGLAGLTARSLTVNAVNNISANGALDVRNSGSGLARLTSSSGSIVLSGATSTFDNATFDAANAISITELSAQNLTLTANNDISASGNLAVQNGGAGVATITSATGNIVLGGTNNNFDDANINAGDSVSIANLSAQNLTLVASNDIDATGNVVVENSGTGDATITSTNGSVALGGADNRFEDVSINAANNVTLASLSAQNLDLVAGSDVNASGNIVVQNNGAGNTNITSTNGSVSLGGAGNNFDDVSINAGNNVTLASLNAQNLTLVAANEINASGNIIVQNSGTGDASITSTNGSVVLSGTGNNFDDVSINAGSNVTVAGLAAQNLTLTAGNDVNTSGDISVQNNGTGVANITATAGSISLGGANNNFDTVSLNAANNVNIAGLSAQDLTVETTNGDIVGSGPLNVQNGGAGIARLTSNNGSILLDTVANNFENVILNAANDANLLETDAINIDGSTIGGALNVTANGNMGVGDITAGTSMMLDAGQGAIVDQSSNLIAPQISLRAAAGIGAGSVNYADGFSIDEFGAIRTTTELLSAINTSSGTININNTGAVTVTDLRNSGDIILRNTGDITLDITENNGVREGAIDANFGGSIEDEVYAGDVAILNDSSDSIFTTGLGFSEADITAENLLVQSVISFGEFGRPIRIRVNNQFTLFASLGSIFYFGGEPRGITTSDDLALQVVDGITGLSGQQLIDVESLDDVDPAIFTEVRNYNYDDISVLLPADQRYTDDEEEEKQQAAE